ncbi:beta-glucoside-specific PTS transporter subunit IIABC [Caenibacillus caldisaponilyticus]|jgi:PTS system beta-glucosides-specific IIC component|uniref:beta-glucoside-specific PTS transporter subunit IIABC n=1 Tax=Caenibacillus caldisaponilyticus TaxID=1674942 RepID=UPI0009884636|nr:beta-glucoside-specific PTS transporter subunit IIABC [Caenibacillus caldisaponilyticus]
MGKYGQLASEIMKGVGGENNVADLYHCMTRLRFTLKDNRLARKHEIEQLDGVISVIESNGQFQVVIGNHVGEVYNELVNQYHLARSRKAAAAEKNEGNLIARGFNLMSSIFTPIVPALAGAGMLKAILVICTTFHWLDAKSSTYLILAAAGNSVFYFLPLLLAFSSAKTFGTNRFVSVAIMGALLEPNFTGLMKNVGDITHFAGIPVVLMSYSSTIIPAILAIWLYSYLERFLKRFTPKSIEMFFVPLVSFLIMVPATAILIGPVGVYAGKGIAAAIEFLSDKSGLITGAILGGGWTFLVMFGLQWGIVPAMLNNLSLKGFDTIRPMMASATFAQSGVALGVFLKAKDKKLKSYALSAILPSLFAGITEPVVYGLSVKYKRPMIAAVIGGAIGGAIAGAFKTTVMAYVFPAITTIPAFMTDTIVYYLISIAVSFILTALLTYILGFDEETGDQAAPEKSEPAPASGVKKTALFSPMKGRIVPLQNVNDPAFSTEAMGKGVAIIPEEGKVYAPVSGTVSALFPTGHAVGIKSDDGLEVLIHVGLNTIQLEGRHFYKKVSQGDKVRQGDLLIEFDLDKVKEAGYDVTTPVVITNSDHYLDIVPTEKNGVTKAEKILYALA